MMNPLVENGCTTQCFQEKFDVVLPFHNFNLNDATTVIIDDSDVQLTRRVITFWEKSLSFVMGQSIHTTTGWSVQIHCGNSYNPFGIPSHCTVGLKLAEIMSPVPTFTHVFCKFRISIADKDGSVLHSRNWRSWTIAKKIRLGDWHTMVDFISLEELFEKRATLIPNNTLRLKCEGVLFSHPRTGHVSFTRNLHLNPSSSFSLELWTKGMECSNVQIVSKEGHAFNAHMAILSKVSPVFYSLLSTLVENMSKMEAQSLTLRIDELTSSDISKLLQFIYTGNVLEQDWANYKQVYHLISIANKYEVRGLKRYCFLKTLSTLRLTSFCEIAELFEKLVADAYFQGCLHKMYLSNQDYFLEQDDFRRFAQEKKNPFLFIVLFADKYLNDGIPIYG